jgi:hypothetical protein
MKLFSKTTHRNKGDQAEKEVSMQKEPAAIKYLKPKILLVDCPKSASSALIKRGFNVNAGTFGKPYKIDKNSGYRPLIGSASLPEHTEQEIVIVDLSIAKLADGPDGEKHRPEGEIEIWAKCDRGFIDPRPRHAVVFKDDFDRILAAGGAFIVFASPKTNIELSLAQVQYRELDIRERFLFDAWGFLSELQDMSVVDDDGTEMHILNDDSSLTRVVKTHLKDSCFTCILEGGYRRDHAWIPIVANKFGQTVGLYRRRHDEGLIIVLPQIANKTELLEELLVNVLPELSPHLFPESGGKWIHLPTYELAAVNHIVSEQARIKDEAQEKIELLDQKIIEERARDGWLFDLLTGTDVELVEAVKKALTEIGFDKIRDVDEEQDRLGKSRREDLQILDQKPVLVVDIKGVGGGIADDDVLQADKHATLRMKETGDTGFRGLSIINHQRHLPPLDREHAMPFRQELVDVAIEHRLGLLTSWDLYRILRNKRKLNWQNDNIRPLLYQHGRIEIIPKHYSFLGIIVKAWSDKFGVVLSEGSLKKGDRIAVEFPIEFEETIADSLQVNSQQVNEAKQNDSVGILWPASLPKVHEGMRIFRVETSPESRSCLISTNPMSKQVP